MITTGYQGLPLNRCSELGFDTYRGGLTKESVGDECDRQTDKHGMDSDLPGLAPVFGAELLKVRPFIVKGETLCLRPFVYSLAPWFPIKR